MVTTSLLAAAAAGAGYGEENAKSGLPQLDFSTFPSQIFWLAVGAVLLFLMMSKIALPRISSVLEERAGAIAGDLDKADELRRAAEDAEKAYHQALADARAKAQGIAAETRAEIQKDIDAAMAKADAEIAARTAESERRIGEIKAEAMQSVAEVANETAVAIVESVLPDAADTAALKSAVQSRL